MRALCPIVIAVSVLVSPAGAQQTPLRQEVESLLTAMVAAFKAEPASVARFYSDDASIMGGGGRHVGREQIDKYWREATMFADWKLEVLEVGGDGPMPWVRGRSTLYAKSGRTMVTEFVGLLKRQPDGLKFYVDIYVAASPGMRRTPGG